MNTKAMSNLLLAGMMPWFGWFIGNAQIIYSNAFNGGAVNINGTAPTAANNYAGGTSAAIWNDALGIDDTNALLANGMDNTALGDSWILPFTPLSGYIYTLTVSLTFTGNPGNWVGVGFAQNDPVNVPAGYGRFADFGNSAPTGYDWLILTESSGNVAYFAGPQANSPAIYSGTGFTNGPQTLAVEMLLNTTNSPWSISAYVNGVQMGSTFTYANNPPIGAVGVTQSSLTAPTAVQWKNLMVEAVGTGPATNTVTATVSFSPTNTGLPLNPSFCGLSYEKGDLANNHFFTATNTAAINLFSLIGPAVLRMGGGTSDSTCWNGISNTVPITAQEVANFASFIHALPTNWTVLYGINFASNNPANCAAEAAYVANALGSYLLGFEIGNEPDEYGNNGIRPNQGWDIADFAAEWRPLAAGITNGMPGWAVTNNGVGWTMTGPADADNTSWTETFASDESGKINWLTQHYYRSNSSLAATNSTNTDTLMSLMLSLDTTLPGTVAGLALAAYENSTPSVGEGFRFDEDGSFVGGGKGNISNAFGAALWSLDFMFTVAENGGQGINFHGGGQSPYSPLVDDGTAVTVVGPEFYALKMFSLLPPGNVIPGTVTPSANANFTAYGVRQADGAISALLNNKSPSNTVAVSVNLGPGVTGAQLIELAAPSLYSISGYTLGGAAISPAGSWAGGVQTILSATNGQLTVNVPPASAFLLNPVTSQSTNLTYGVSGNQLTLSWPMNYTGWLLQSNSTGLAGTNWFPVPGSGNTNRVQLMIQPGLSNVFYRLALP
jgi:hypothetical protein